MLVNYRRLTLAHTVEDRNVCYGTQVRCAELFIHVRVCWFQARTCSDLHGVYSTGHHGGECSTQIEFRPLKSQARLAMITTIIITVRSAWVRARIRTEARSPHVSPLGSSNMHCSVLHT